jgi:outer membrane protein insertion porin family
MPSALSPFARIAVWLLALCPFCAVVAVAQTAPSGEQPRVIEVRVVTESGAVLEQNPPQLQIQPGQPFSTDAESASLRQLFGSGLYADVRAELTDVPGGVRLEFVVRRNYYINKVEIQGLREPPSESLALSVLRLDLGQPFRESDMKEAVESLRQTLEDEGEYEAKVEYKLTPHPETRQMDILVMVTPGPRARIGSVRIENETAFPEEELRERLKLKPGNEITTERLNRATERVRKWLADQDYLGARVTLHRGAYDAQANTVPLEAVFYAGLQVHVAVEGASISSRTLRRLLPIYQEGAVDEDLLQEGRRNLRDYFEREGYFNVKVSYTNRESIPGSSAEGRQTGARLVTYDIELGERQRLVGVAFSGNHYFSSELLSDRLKIQPAAYASPGKFSSSMLQDDVASIHALYEANGFHDIEVTSRTTEDYQGRHGDLFVQFEIKEGLQTRVSSLVLEGNHALSTEDLLGVVGSTTGQPYSDFNVASDRDNILALYYDKGFPDARFSADMEKVPQETPEGAPRVRLTYHITEGRQEMVKQVLLSGYVHTKPGVIARQVDLRAGEPLSEGAVVDTQRKLYNLGIFNRVSIAPQNPEGDDPEKTVVVLVDEARRYTVAYGGGFEAQRLGSGGSSAVAGSLRFSPRATLEVTKANFTGRADTLSFKVRASTIQGRALLAYTAPNYFGRPDFSLQVTGFFEKTSNVQTFDVKRYEASVQLAQRLSLASTLLYRYSYRWVLPTNVHINPQEVPLFSQRTNISEFGLSWVHDRRNNPVDASRGDFENVDVSLASKPIGSSANFFRVFLQNSTYHPIGRRLVFARSFRFGVQTPYGGTPSSEIPLPERFFGGGGTTLRGFGLNQAGPRDPFTGFPVGGQALLIFNQELRFPMHLPLVGNRLGGAVFYDAGNVFTSVRDITLRTAPPAPVFDPNNSALCIANCSNELNYFSHTVGFEFRYRTPIGPVAVDLGYQLNPARFLVQSGGTCPSPTLPNTTCSTTLSRLPGFQFFVNLGATF